MMKSVNLGSVEAVNVSDAVARGRAVIEALETTDRVLLDTDETDGDEAVWSELEAYLGRRGVSVAYDHDAGYPVARRA
jgi:hypothetical protein